MDCSGRSTDERMKTVSFREERKRFNISVSVRLDSVALSVIICMLNCRNHLTASFSGGPRSASGIKWISSQKTF